MSELTFSSLSVQAGEYCLDLKNFTPMFKKGSKSMEDTTINDEIETVVGPSVKIEGDFASQGNIMISGKLSGKLTTTQNLRVEENAEISADITAKQAIVAGTIHGNILIKEYLEILSTAHITGDIQAGSLSIQQGARINGNCAMDNAKTEQTSQATKQKTEQNNKEQDVE